MAIFTKDGPYLCLRAFLIKADLATAQPPPSSLLLLPGSQLENSQMCLADLRSGFTSLATWCVSAWLGSEQISSQTTDLKFLKYRQLTSVARRRKIRNFDTHTRTSQAKETKWFFNAKNPSPAYSPGRCTPSCGSKDAQQQLSSGSSASFTAVYRARLGIHGWKVLPSMILGTLSDKHAYTACTSWTVSVRSGSRCNEKLTRPSRYS